MLRQIKCTVPGASPTNESIKVMAAYDLSTIASCDLADEAMVEQALITAYTLYRERKGWLKLHERIEILERLVQLMSEDEDRLAYEAAQEGGKPLVDSQVEVIRAIDGIKICIETLRTQSGETIPMGITAASADRLAFTSPEPIGVVVALSAFNHPLNLIVHQVAPAIATGCPVIVKPAITTPISCSNFAALLAKAGLPEGWCQMLMIDDHGLTAKLVSDARVGFFSFIGSPKVGWMLRSKLAAGTRCALEHGGAAPVIVAEDATIEDALPKLVKGGFYHAGQVCVSVQRVYAHESIARQLADDIAHHAKALVVGDPLQKATEVGPLISPKEVERVSQWVNEAKAAGAQILAGGKALSPTCYAPTVIYNPSAGAKVSLSEVFGPVICIYPYSDLDQAIGCANQLSFAFQASIFTKDIEKATYAYRRLDASAVMINDHTAFRVDWMPFAGLRQSGLGVGGIPYTMHDMQNQKMMVIANVG
jgi:acyl-CoA reductase-like NAD-dependent aldehyde dehydrogenase